MIMQTHTAAAQSAEPFVQAPDERLVLLEEIDFKWLMAGQGWWVDTARLHNDPSYADHWLAMVDATKSVALQDCVNLLRARVGRGH
jgi:hypothetical protein